MGDGLGLAVVLSGMDGVRVLAVDETTDELVVTVESTTTVAACARRRRTGGRPRCGI